MSAKELDDDPEVNQAMRDAAYLGTHALLRAVSAKTWFEYLDNFDTALLEIRAGLEVAKGPT